LTQDEIKALIKAQSAGWTELHEKHFAGLTDMTLIVLKGHLLVEQLLTALLLHHYHTPAEVGEAGLRFYQKVALVKAIVSPSFPDECWKMVKLINEMRNDFAHNLEPTKLKQHLQKVCAIAETHRKAAPNEFQFVFDTDEGRVKFLISFCIGFLSSVDSVIQMQKS
jgi:hypothetical protein